MDARHPLPDITPGGIAPHIAADFYRQLDTDGTTRVVVVHAPPAPAPRSYVGPVCVILATAAGTTGLVFAVLALIQIGAELAATVAGMTPAAGLGITLKLARPKKG